MSVWRFRTDECRCPLDPEEGVGSPTALVLNLPNTVTL